MRTFLFAAGGAALAVTLRLPEAWVINHKELLASVGAMLGALIGRIVANREVERHERKCPMKASLAIARQQQVELLRQIAELRDQINGRGK